MAEESERGRKKKLDLTKVLSEYAQPTAEEAPFISDKIVHFFAWFASKGYAGLENPVPYNIVARVAYNLGKTPQATSQDALRVAGSLQTVQEKLLAKHRLALFPKRGYGVCVIKDGQQKAQTTVASLVQRRENLDVKITAHVRTINPDDIRDPEIRRWLLGHQKIVSDASSAASKLPKLLPPKKKDRE